MAQAREKITRLTCDDLRSLEAGQTKSFSLPDARACRNGRALVYQYQHLLGCKFTTATDYVTNSLTITRREI